MASADASLPLHHPPLTCINSLPPPQNTHKCIAVAGALFLLYHWTGCGLAAVQAFEGAACNWVHTFLNFRYGDFPCEPLVVEPLVTEVYSEALYFTLSHNANQLTLVTLGEKVYAMFALLIIDVFTATLIGELFGLIERLGLEDKEHVRRMDELNRFMAVKRVPPALAYRLRAYFRLQKTMLPHGASSWGESLDHVSPSLRAEVAVALNRTFMDQARFPPPTFPFPNSPLTSHLPSCPSSATPPTGCWWPWRRCSRRRRTRRGRCSCARAPTRGSARCRC